MTNAEVWEQLLPRNCGKDDPLRHRNRLLLLLATLVGLREKELTLAPIGLFVSGTGELQEIVVLPAAVTWDGYERPVVLSHPEVKAAMESYLDWLKEEGINTHPDQSHMGFNPDAPLLVTDRLQEFRVQQRGKRVSPHMMNGQLDRLIKAAGLWDAGVRRKSLIRTYVIEAYRAGMSTSDIMLTTGQSQQTIEQTLVMDVAQYDRLVKWFTDRKNQKVKRQEAFKRRRKWMI